MSLLLVFLVLVWVYPLRVLFGVGFGWLSYLLLPQGWHLPTNFEFIEVGDLQIMFVVYGVAWSTLGLVIAFLYRQGWKQRNTLGLSREERLATRAEIARWLWIPVTGGFSIVLAVLIPAKEISWLAGVPGMAYVTMAFGDTVMRASRRRWTARVDAEISKRE